MINIDKNKLISVEDYCNEMGRLIFYFDQTINTIKSDSKALVVYLTLIKKIISNADAANKLIFEGHIKESKIILRSAVESVILITYLSQFPEKIEDYLDEAQILKIKNNFIIYKNMRDGEPIDVNGTTISKEELSAENEKCFNSIQEQAKQKILKGIGIKEYKINNSNFEKFDKYFTNFRPQFIKYEKMFKELDDIGFKLEDDFIFGLRDIVYGFYNDSSQIAHGCFLDWSEPTHFTQKEAEYMFHFFIKVTLFLKVLLKGSVNFENDHTPQFVREMRKSNDKLEIIIYGQLLQH